MPAAALTAQHMFRAELRRAQRDDVSYRTTMSASGRSGLDAQLVNISPYGFMARMRDDLRQGDEVRLALPRDEIKAATVVWALGGRVGAEFHEPVGVDEYRWLLSDIAAAPAGWEMG